MDREDIGFYNGKCAKALLTYLRDCGVEHFCMSPGSRSTPLVLALNSLKGVKTCVHFDERGMAFYALGVAKATQKPVALFVTSGTAVANLFPAIMEASLSRIPLIILTADRPQENYFCGANQTVDQAKIFAGYVRFQFDLSCSDPFITETFIAKLSAQAVHSAWTAPRGPVHINCQFREPLFSSTPIPEPTAKLTHYEKRALSLPLPTLEKWAALFEEKKKGAIVIGTCPSKEDASFLYALAAKLKWPIFADILSNARKDDPCCIAHYNLLLKNGPLIEWDCVLHLGDIIVSKTVLESLKAPHYLLVADHPERHDPQNKVTDRIEYDPYLFCKELYYFTEEKEDTSWLEEWKHKEKEVLEKLEHFFKREERMTEPSFFWHLQKILKLPLVLPNSMPVRDADTFFFPKSNSFPIYSNRGVSGSDGNIATAVGIAEGLQSPVLAIFGDIAVLHDLNSLALIKKAKYPVICVIINNQGGGIFSFLPIAEKTDLLEEFFATAHNFTFEKAAAFFELPYSNDLSAALESPLSQIIEIRTNRQDNVIHHKELNTLCTETAVAIT